jgi:hypothetical protein
MKRTKASRRLMLMIATGLLLTSSTTLLNKYVNMPDAALGVITGVGIGIMIAGLVWERRGSECVDTGRK